MACWSLRSAFFGLVIYIFTFSAFAQPVADAGNDVTINSGEQVQLDANGVGQRDKLREIALGLLNYHDTFLHFPAYAAGLFSESNASFCNFQSIQTATNPDPLFSWRVCILPFIGEQDLFDQFDRFKPWDDPVNLPLLDQMPAVFRAAGEPSNSTHTRIAGVFSPLDNGSTVTAFNSGIDDGVAYIPDVTRLRDALDGASNTLIVGEITRTDIPWTAPGDIDVLQQPDFCDPQGFDSSSSDTVNMAYMDGSVRAFSCLEDTANQANLFNSQDGMLIDRLINEPDFGIRYEWDFDGDGLFEIIGANPVFDSAGISAPTSVEVTLKVVDEFGNEALDSLIINILSTDDEPPVIELKKSVLKLPYWYYYGIFSVRDLVKSVSDNEDSSLKISDVKIVSVDSDEAPRRPNPRRDLAHSFADCRYIALKAARYRNGNGRVYTVELNLTDANGNTGSAEVEVQVPVWWYGHPAIKDETEWQKQFECGAP